MVWEEQKKGCATCEKRGSLHLYIYIYFNSSIILNTNIKGIPIQGGYLKRGITVYAQVECKGLNYPF